MMHLTPKRMVATLIILLIGLVAVLPIFSGWLVKKRYNQLVSLSLDVSGIKTSTLKYEQNWFTSVVETFVEVEDRTFGYPLKAPRLKSDIAHAPVGFLVRHKIFHGPIIHDPYSEAGFHLGQALVYSTAILAKKEGNDIQPLLEAKELARARTTLMINGTGDSRIESLAFNLTTEDEEKVNWKGLRADWRFTGSFLKSDFKFNAPGLNLASKGFTLNFSDLRIDTMRSQGIEAIWVGDGAVSLKSLDFGDGKKTAMAISGLKMTANNTLRQNDLLDSSVQINFAKLVLDNHVFGSGNIEGTLRNMDAIALASIQTTAHAVKEGKESDNKHPVAEETLKRLPEILANKPELEIAITDVDTDQGQIDAQMRVALGGGEPDDTPSAIEALETLEANLHFTMPKEVMLLLLEQALGEDVAVDALHRPLTDEEFQTLLRQSAVEKLKALEAEGMLVVRHDMVEFTGDIKDEKLTINGKRKIWPF